MSLREEYVPPGARPALGLVDKCPAEACGLHHMTCSVLVEGEERDSGLSVVRFQPVLKS